VIGTEVEYQCELGIVGGEATFGLENLETIEERARGLRGRQPIACEGIGDACFVVEESDLDGMLVVVELDVAKEATGVVLGDRAPPGDVGVVALEYFEMRVAGDERGYEALLPFFFFAIERTSGRTERLGDGSFCQQVAEALVRLIAVDSGGQANQIESVAQGSWVLLSSFDQKRCRMILIPASFNAFSRRAAGPKPEAGSG
jgi:hypothetical protein